MVRVLDDLHLALVVAHRVLHPPHGVLRDALVPVAIPDANRMGVRRVGEAPWLPVVVENLQEVPVGALRRLRVGRCDERVAELCLVRDARGWRCFHPR